MAQKSILSDTPKNLIRKYKSVLEQKGIPVERIILFGSYAKGNPKPWSDLDICVVSKKFGRNSYDETVLLEQFTLLVDPMLEPHPMHPDELNNFYNPLAYEIKQTGKRLA